MIFNLDNIRMNISADDLLKELPETVIYKYYCRDFPSNSVQCPFPGVKDNNPSFSFFYDTKWLWKYFKTGEAGDVFQFVGKMENLHKFNDIIHFLYMKFSTSFSKEFEDKVFENSQKKQRVEKLLQVVKRDDFDDNDRRVWDKWGINEIYLNFFLIGPIHQVFLNKQLLWQHRLHNPAYYFYFPWTQHLKCYRPLELDKTKKFLGTIDNNIDIQGLYQVNVEKMKPRVMVLQKAMKEVAFLKMFGIFAIAVHGENHRYSKEFIDYLKLHCTHIISFYDADKAGYHGAWTLRNEFDIPCMFIPTSWKAKNITDLWETDYKKCYEVIQFIAEYGTPQQQLTQYKNIIEWKH